MDIIVSGRHVTVSDEMKEYVKQKLETILDGRPLKITTVRVILDIQKNRHKAEVIVHIKHHDLEADAETYDMYESIDAMVEKIEVQILRYLDKAQDHHKAGRTARKIPKDEIPEFDIDEDI